jgi:hypothetical protein
VVIEESDYHGITEGTGASNAVVVGCRISGVDNRAIRNFNSTPSIYAGNIVSNTGGTSIANGEDGITAFNIVLEPNVNNNADGVVVDNDSVVIANRIHKGDRGVKVNGPDVIVANNRISDTDRSAISTDTNTLTDGNNTNSAN